MIRICCKPISRSARGHYCSCKIETREYMVDDSGQFGMEWVTKEAMRSIWLNKLASSSWTGGITDTVYLHDD